MSLDWFHHSQLPVPLDRYISLLILEDVPHGDILLLGTCIVLTALVFIQLRAFARPPPVPLKTLPQRPALHILFKPDDTAISFPVDNLQAHANSTEQKPKLNTIRSMTNSIFRNTGASLSGDDPMVDVEEHDTDALPPRAETWHTAASVDLDERSNDTAPPESPFLHFRDLPDSFAPLLSSSQVEVLLNQLTTDLIHAVQVEGRVNIREGRHEIPLDKDNSRPQFVVEAPKGGCRLTAVAGIGSDRLSLEEDLDVTRPTISRSRPMVKHAGVVLDPPLPLANVAPTLIHFPTLFQDNLVPTLRRIQIVRFVMDAIASCSSFLEKVLWIIESKCQIHLSRVQITPLFKGCSDGHDPQWRLSLAFSGHVLLFGLIQIPFISITLPTFVIPQPHALLEYLLTPEPLASAKLNRENIAEKRIALAGLDIFEVWNLEFKAVATPPAIGVDITLPGGVALALEVMHGRDAGIRRQDNESQFHGNNPKTTSSVSGNSLSSWTTNAETGSNLRSFRRGLGHMPSTPASIQPFDANNLVPWFMHLSAKGVVSRERLSIHIIKCTAQHEDTVSAVPTKSSFSTSGSFAVWRADLSKVLASENIPADRKASYGHLVALASSEEAPSVGAMLLYPDDQGISSRHRLFRMLEYDYAFEIWDDTQIDAITLAVGASHPMLKGGTMVTLILESIYALGSITARENAIIDPGAWKRKRNVLLHLPAVDFTFGIQNAFIPPESLSYSDDGQTKCIPEMEGGRMMVRIVGGIGQQDANHEAIDERAYVIPVPEGIKVVADFGLESLTLNNESNVKEFPELDIMEGVKLLSLLSGAFTGRVSCHLRPQNLSLSMSTIGPNKKNPLEAYEIDFSQSNLSFKVKEASSTLGHRRIIIPTETTIMVKVVNSVVDMSLEGNTSCELSWDFQGLSPILQVTDVGKSPAAAVHENRQQVALLISALRQGRLNFHVSAVGGIAIQKAATSREDRDGLYDWKFFNAIVSPDQESGKRLMKVLHDKKTMEKMLQVIKLVNMDLHRVLRYVLDQVWRAKEIFDQEGVTGPGHAIPGHKMARLLSLFLCGDVSQVDVLRPIIQRVTSGDGLDAVKVKELLRQHVELYDDYAPEIDRAIRWASMMLDPMSAPQPYVEKEVPPLSQLSKHACRFVDIPSASQLYDQIRDRPQLPLDPLFSNLLSRVAPYLSFKQIEYFLQVRSPTDWQPSDLKRIRYVYSVKKKVLDISESYGGLSFLPQSFLVSVFLGEATRASLRVSRRIRKNQRQQWQAERYSKGKSTTLSALRRRRMQAPRNQSSLGEIMENADDNFVLTPAARVASQAKFVEDSTHGALPGDLYIELEKSTEQKLAIEEGAYELGDSLLGPADVAVLLQAGLTSAMKSSTVVQLNQRMLLDLIASQPRSFAVAVLAEIGTPGGQGSPRSMASALMALLELDQTSFTEIHRLDMHALLESWLPGFKIPQREHFMAGGRWARQSFYEAIYNIATDILEDAECYMALKGHVQRDRRSRESDPIPGPREFIDDNSDEIGMDVSENGHLESFMRQTSKLNASIIEAKASIEHADQLGRSIMGRLIKAEVTKGDADYREAIEAYQHAFSACAMTLSLDKLAFQAEWFANFYRRNFEALMIKSMYDNVIEDVDNTREWFTALRRGSKVEKQRKNPMKRSLSAGADTVPTSSPKSNDIGIVVASGVEEDGELSEDDVFSFPEKVTEQALVDAILDAIIFTEKDRESLGSDPLVRLLIPNPPGDYNFVIVTAMGVITEGERGLELQAAFERIKAKRGVSVVRADTGTARSLEFNASKISEAVETVTKMKKPYGLLGYSQGCANALTAESLLLSGSPIQQQAITNKECGLVCRQLLFSAANGSIHGTASNKKVQRLIVMCEEFFKYQQGYFSRALTSSVLEALNNTMDSAPFQKFIGGAQSMLPEGCRAFWREAQHLSHIPTCTMRGVLEPHTTPESLEMISNLLTKQSGSALHDSQVHVYDAVGYPIYTHNRNGQILKNCNVGEGSIQRTHHWSPLSDEVVFMRTKRDIDHATFECAKDRHVFPWVDVNARFGFIKYTNKQQVAGHNGSQETLKNGNFEDS